MRRWTRAEMATAMQVKRATLSVIHNLWVGFAKDLRRICVGFASMLWDLRFAAGAIPMGKQRKERDSFPPTYPLYNIKRV